MLMVSKRIQKLLELADFIEGLHPSKFSLSTWGLEQEPRCICGWFQHNRCRMDKDNWRDAAAVLGMDEWTASKMFNAPRWAIDNKHAAKVLRHYAVTGEFHGW